MITRTVLSRYKHDGRALIKNYFLFHSFHNVSYEYLKKNLFMKTRILLSDIYRQRSFSTIQYNNVRALVSTKVGAKTSRYDNDRRIFGTTGLLDHAEAIKNSIRHYSSVLPPIDNRILYVNTGLFKAISESTPVEYMQNALVSIHSSTGLPWWAVIALTTLLLRTTITFPLMLYQQSILAKVENLKLEMKAITKQAQIEAAYGIQYLHWDKSYAKQFCARYVREEWNKLILRDNCHPVKAAVLVIIQLPLWVTLSFALRNICFMLPVYNQNAHETYLQFTTGGFGWMLNLTDIDHSYMFPLILGSANLLIIEVQYMMRIQEQTRIGKYLTNILRIISVCMVPLTAIIPSCLTLFWATSSVGALFHHLLLMSPKIRRLGGVPKTNTELQYPYAELRRRIKDRFWFKGQTESPTKL